MELAMIRFSRSLVFRAALALSVLAVPRVSLAEAPAAPKLPTTQPSATTKPAEEAADPLQKPDRVGWLELSAALSDVPPHFTFSPVENAESSLRRVTREIRKVAREPRYA